MVTLQIRVDEVLKQKADGLFASLGLDTSTAVRIFLNAAVEHDGIPFHVGHNSAGGSLRQAIEDTLPSAETQEALDDARLLRNLHGPYGTAGEAVEAMLKNR